VVLALGVLSLIPPFMLLPLGLPAWLMARNDIRAMNDRRMDAAGRTPTQVGHFTETRETYSSSAC